MCVKGAASMDKDLRNDLIVRAGIMYERCQKLIREFMPEKWYQSKLEFEIKDDKEINGRAWCEGNTDYIEINSGVIENYYNYFFKVMEYFRVITLKKLGYSEEKSECETMSIETIRFKADDVYLLDSKVGEKKKTILLEVFVSRFIVLHELGHIINGHCKFLKKSSNGTMEFMPMYFNEKKVLSEKEALDIRTLEMDADSFAATQSMAHNIFLYTDFENQVAIYDIEPKDIFYWWAFAIRSHFLVSEDSHRYNNYFKTMTHLPSVARWTMIYTIAIELIDEYNISEGEKESFKREIDRGTMCAEEVFNEIKFSNYSWINEISATNHFKLYKSEVDDNWENIKKKLNEYTRLPLW